MATMSGIAVDGGVDDAGPSMPGSRRSVTTMSKANWSRRPSACFAAVGLDDVDSPRRRAARPCAAQRRLVVDEQQMACRVRHLATGAKILTTWGTGRQQLELRRSVPIVLNDSRGIRYAAGGMRPMWIARLLSIMKACELVGVSRRTIYNWISSGKVEYVRTAGGSMRIFADSLWRKPDRSDGPGGAEVSTSRGQATTRRSMSQPRSSSHGTPSPQAPSRSPPTAVVPPAEQPAGGRSSRTPSCSRRRPPDVAAQARAGQVVASALDALQLPAPCGSDGV